MAGVGGDAGPDLTMAGLRRSREWLELWLKRPSAWKGDTLMPDHRLPGTDLKALAAYLAGLKGEAYAGERAPWDRPSLKDAPLRRGRVIYARAGCAACHGPRGEGGHPNTNVPGGLIPSLAAVAGTYTKEELKARIRRGSTPEPEDPGAPAPLVSMPAWGGVLDEAELDAVAAFVLSLAREPGADW